MKQQLQQITNKSLRFGYHKFTILYTRLKYYKFKSNHIFKINVDDINFKMSFADYKLQGAIVQRIEGKREKDTVAIIKSIVHDGSKVLELGGCYGYFTLIMSKCVGPSGRVVSIEGTPNNYTILCNNLQLNEINNVDTYNLFLTKASEFATFSPYDKSPYDAINRLKTKSEDATVKVTTVHLGSFLNQINYKPDYVFMDIEGFEVDAIESLSDSHFPINKPIIVFETHPAFYQKEKGLDYIINILETHQYRYRQIGDNLICFPITI